MAADPPGQPPDESVGGRWAGARLRPVLGDAGGGGGAVPRDRLRDAAAGLRLGGLRGAALGGGDGLVGAPGPGQGGHGADGAHDRSGRHPHLSGPGLVPHVHGHPARWPWGRRSRCRWGCCWERPRGRGRPQPASGAAPGRGHDRRRDRGLPLRDPGVPAGLQHQRGVGLRPELAGPAHLTRRPDPQGHGGRHADPHQRGRRGHLAVAARGAADAGVAVPGVGGVLLGVGQLALQRHPHAHRTGGAARRRRSAPGARLLRGRPPRQAGGG